MLNKGIDVDDVTLKSSMTSQCDIDIENELTDDINEESFRVYEGRWMLVNIPNQIWSN